MRYGATRNIALLTISCLLILSVKGAAANPPTPNPILVFMGAEYFDRNGTQLVRYTFDVFNKEAFPTEMFAPSPSLPPCGNNTRASRTWVDIFDQTGKRLNGFCALGKPADLNGLWIALPADVIPPSWVYIELNDRQTNTKYKSNLAETTM